MPDSSFAEKPRDTGVPDDFHSSLLGAALPVEISSHPVSRPYPRSIECEDADDAVMLCSL